MVVIARPANGTSLYISEYFLNDGGDILKFETRNEALMYLLNHENYTLNDIENEHIQFIYTNEKLKFRCSECEHSEYCYSCDDYGNYIYSKSFVDGCPKSKKEWRAQFTKYAW